MNVGLKRRVGILALSVALSGVGAGGHAMASAGSTHFADVHVANLVVGDMARFMAVPTDPGGGCEGDIIEPGDLCDGGGGGGGGGDTDPVPTDPAPTDPAPTDPAPTDPAPTDPAPTDPAPTDPDPTDPAPTDPAPTDPAPTNPAPIDPAPTDPAPTDPAPTDPAPTDPAPTDPAPTAPVPTNPAPSNPAPVVVDADIDEESDAVPSAVDAIQTTSSAPGVVQASASGEASQASVSGASDVPVVQVTGMPKSGAGDSAEGAYVAMLAGTMSLLTLIAGAIRRFAR